MTLETLIADYLAHCRERNLSPLTVRTYEILLRDVFGGLLDKPPSAITTERIRGKCTNQGRASRTANHRRAVVLVFCEWLRMRSYISKNPVTWPPAKVPKDLPKYLNTSDVDKLTKAADAASPLERAIVYLLLYTGARAAEAGAMRLRDIDPADNVVHIRKGKGDKDRSLPLHPALRAVLVEWIKARPDTPEPELFVYPNTGHRIRRNEIHRIVSEMGKRAGIEQRVYPHLLRHTFGTRLMAAKAPPNAVQELMGHASIVTTMRYAHVTPEALRGAIDCL